MFSASLKHFYPKQVCLGMVGKGLNYLCPSSCTEVPESASTGTDLTSAQSQIVSPLSPTELGAAGLNGI